MNDAARSQFVGQHSKRWGRDRQMYQKVKTNDSVESDDDVDIGIFMNEKNNLKIIYKNVYNQYLKTSKFLVETARFPGQPQINSN